MSIESRALKALSVLNEDEIEAVLTYTLQQLPYEAIVSVIRKSSYDPQQRVAEMMHIFGQEVRPLPTMIEDPKERLLAANLVVEEALEFADALGFIPTQLENGEVTLVPSGREPDLMKAVDAIGDTLVVTYGGANRLGVNAQAAFAEVDRSNKSKIFPDGTVHRRESDGKVLKPDTYSPADIESVLCKSEPLPYASAGQTVAA